MVHETSIQEINDRLAKQIIQDAKVTPNSPFAHKFVGIVNGKVVVVADTLREVDDRLDEVEPDPSNCRIVDTISDYDTVQEIWSAR